jgi:Domain of unknown function (DUF4249)
MKRTTYLLVFLLPMLLVGLVGCNPEKEVEIEIPPYDRQLVAECFMEVGKPFRLLLSESIGFFEGLDTPIVTGAVVIISHDNVHDTLLPGLDLEPLGFKIFNYYSRNIIPQDYNTLYKLEIIHPDGRRITGEARIVPKVDMGVRSISYNADSLASLTMNWQDIPSQSDYYLLTLHKGTVYHGNENRPSPLEFIFTLDDRIGDGQMFTIGTLFNYESGDTLISSLYHIDHALWSYLNSLEDAQSSNGNPFAQPGAIRSNLVGGLGVFSGFDMDRDTLIVP